MGAWQKIFTDGSLEDGSDEAIAKRKASWTNGRLEDIKEVKLFNNHFICSLTVPNTTWHQFDRFAVLVSEGTQFPMKLHQVVQAEITSKHVGLSLMSSNVGGSYCWILVKDSKELKNYTFCESIEEKHIGKWLSIILPRRDYPKISFLIKGKIHDNKHLSK